MMQPTAFTVLIETVNTKWWMIDVPPLMPVQ